jgi:branched-chain amino acid transport system permease protein
MHLLVQALVIGVLIGGIYALLAAGLSLIFGVVRVANFAHGAIFMIGGYIAYYVRVRGSSPMIVAVLAAFVGSGILGYLVYMVFLWPVHRKKVDRPEEFVLITTFALTLFLGASALLLFGPNDYFMKGFWTKNLSLGSWVHVSGDTVVAFAAAALFAGVLWLVISRTALGRGWRALTENRLGAEVVGVNATALSALAFGISGGLAGTAGALLAPVFLVDPSVGQVALIKSFVIVMIGGLGSIEGALLGGLCLGLAEALGTIYVSSTYRDAYGFLVLIAVLLVRPQGFFGTKVRTI